MIKIDEMMKCQNCSEEVKRNNSIQKYCSPCNGIVSRKSNRDKKYQKRHSLPNKTIKDTKCPCAYLFSNGNAAFFDEFEDQIASLQTHGWKGLHQFRERYPEAPVSLQLADPIHPDVLPYLLENIIDPRLRIKEIENGQ